MTNVVSTACGAGQEPVVQFAILTELQRFVEQAKITLRSKERATNQLHSFANERCLDANSDLGRQLRQFVENTIAYVKESSKSLEVVADGPRIGGQRLDRLIIANHLWNCRTRREELRGVDRQQWDHDILNVLSFLSGASKRRYEHTAAEMAIGYTAKPHRGIGYGRLGRFLLDNYKAILRLGSARTLIVTEADCVITDIRNVFPQPFLMSNELLPIPPRLAGVQQVTSPRSDAGIPIVFTLNANGTSEILSDGELVFRLVNNVWRFIEVGSVLEELKNELIGCSRQPEVIARNILTLSMELADEGKGALLYLCKEPTTDVLQHQVTPRESLIRPVPRSPGEELAARSQFTQLIGSKHLTLNCHYEALPRLVRNVCSVDGATAFSYNGMLLGFGCIIRHNTSTGTPPRTSVAEGSGSNAAEHISRTGIAIKVSSDGDATLFIRGTKRGRFY